MGALGEQLLLRCGLGAGMREESTIENERKLKDEKQKEKEFPLKGKSIVVGAILYM